MRAIWKGAVSFGLVNVPVRVYAATGEKDVKFHQVHEEDGGRIRYKRVCSVDGEEVPYAEIAKGYETEDGELVVLTDEDFADLPLTTNREIEVVEFVPADQVDPIMFAKCYYLEPDKTAAKPYALLREALTETDRMAVVKVALRQRETLAVLRVRDKVICLQTMLWPDEVRAADFDVLDADVDLKPAELTMASSLVESLASDFDPDEFSDGYTEALQAVIEAKISSGEVRQPQVESEDEGKGGAEVVDLLTALQRSVEKAKASRGESSDASASDEGDEAPARGASKRSGTTGTKTSAAKKTTAKKTTAKKSTGSAAKKATAKKSAAKKSTGSTAKKSTAKKSTRKSA
ncbi:non-homologous end joining protein Ku [Thalassiella azotivora]